MWSRIRALVQRKQLDRELDDEIQHHLQMLAREQMAAGMSEEDSWAHARRQFGGITQVKEAHRDLRGIPALENLWHDFRFAWRAIRRNPRFSALVVLTLAAGIGANTAMLSLLNAVVLRPLPYPDAERIMVVLSSTEKGDHAFYSAEGVFLDWRDRSTSFESLEGGYSTSMIASVGAQPKRISVVRVTAGTFALMDAHPIIGRLFSSEEDLDGRERSVLLDEGYWEREFGRRAAVLGRRLVLNDQLFTIVGVMPRSVRFVQGRAEDVWMPLGARREARAGGPVIAMGRLKPGITRSAAQAEMESVMRGIGSERREDSKTGVQVQPMREWLANDVRVMFQMVSGAAGLMFLICCANVATLVLARLVTCHRELAIRSSLGAGPFRLFRYLAAESLLLTTAGGLAGAALAALMIRAIPSIETFSIPRAHELVPDWQFGLFAAGTTLISLLVFGVVLVSQVSGRRVGRSLHPGTGAREGGRARNVLVASQIAFALVLLTGAGMLLRGLWSMLSIEVGFQREGVIKVQTDLPWRKYDQARERQFAERLASEVQRLPGVRLVGTTDYAPLEAVLFPYEISDPGSGRRAQLMGRHVTAGYFKLLGIPLLAGRGFEAADGNRQPVPVVINRRAAQELFGDTPAVGKIVKSNYRNRSTMVIVGVAGDTRQLALTEAPGPQIYVPAQFGSSRVLLIRTEAGTADLSASIRQLVRNLDPEVPAPEVRSLQGNFERYVARPRFYASLVGAYAVTGLLLAALGVYGLTSYTVARRMNEFGIRISLGATPADIAALVLSDGLRLMLAGAVVGTCGAVMVTRLLASVVYGGTPNDPGTIVMVLMLLVGVGLFACWLGARRAARANAAVVLRAE